MNFKQLCESTPEFTVETRITENKITLEWKKVPHADGYRVFSSPHGKNRFVGYDNTTDTKMTISGLKNGVALDYKVKAFRIADGPDNFFAQSAAVVACPMQTPKNLRATVNGGGIILSWSGSATFDGYKIYCCSSGDKFSFLCYCGKLSCKLSNFNRYGNIKFRVRGFKIIDGIEKISNYSETAEIVYVKSAGVTASDEKEIKHPSFIGHTVQAPRFEVKNKALKNDNNKCVIMLGGDISPRSSVQKEAAASGYSFDFTMRFISDIFKSSDFSAAALDVNLDDSKSYSFENENAENCPSALADTLCKSGIDAVAINSGLLKKKPAALEQYPLSVISHEGCTHGKKEFKTVNINNINVAFISTAIDADVSGAISQAKKQGAEFIIAYCSWKEKHSPVVKDSWRRYAARLAGMGADFIVGCGLNTLCEYDVIKTSDGRNVSVAYSIGCIVSNEAVTRFEDVGALICLRLKRDISSGKIINEFTGYLPFVMKQAGRAKCAFLLTDVNRRYFTDSEYDGYLSFIAQTMGDKISPARGVKENREFSFALNGSALISELFAKNENVTTDRSHLFISQLTICGEKRDTDEKYYRDSIPALYHNLCKGFKEYLADNKKDYLILDLYYTAAATVFELDGVLYSGGSAFINSGFYRENKDRLKKVDIKKDSIWKKYLDSYIDDILSVYSGRNIILVNITDPKLYFINGGFVKHTDEAVNFKLLLEMETYFIKRVSPIVIDVSRFYCGTVNKRGSCYAVNRDSRFAQNISDIALSLAEGKPVPQGFTNSCDNRLWLESVAQYFDSIKKCGCDSFFFSESNAADYVISRTSADFISSNFSALLDLKSSGLCSFSQISAHFNFGENMLLKKVFGAIRSIKRGDFADKDIIEIIRLNLCAQNDLASALSEFFDKNGIISDCHLTVSNLDIYLKCAQMYLNGNKTAVTLFVREFYNKHKAAAIDLWGGSNLRAIADCSKNAVIGNEISDCSFLTAFEKPVDVDYSYIESKTVFFKELSRGFTEKLKKPSEWILIDFNEIIRPVYTHGDTYFSEIADCEDTKIFKAFCEKDKKILPYAKKGGLTKTYIKKSVKALADFLTEKYGEKIILSRFSLNSNYMDFNGRIRPFSDSDIELKNRLIAFAEEEFIKLTDCYVLSYNDKFISKQTAVRPKAFTAAFEEMFYTSSASALDRILGGEDKKQYCNVDILEYIERAEKIKKSNPDMTDGLTKQLFGGMSELVAGASLSDE